MGSQCNGFWENQVKVTVKKTSDGNDESKYKKKDINSIEELLELARKNNCCEVIVGLTDGKPYVEIWDTHR
jgi:hypothetical protein